VTETHAGSQPGAAAPRSAVPRRDRLHALRLAAAVIWILVILALCWTPKFVVHKVEDDSFFELPSLDKFVHGVIFIVLAILWLRVASSRRAIWTIILGGFALGIISELGQMMPFVQRDANLFDMLTDWAGVLIGIAAAPLVEPWLAGIERRLIREPQAEPLAADR
jgi:cytochrome bd-type quinol oxidase subunit 2